MSIPVKIHQFLQHSQTMVAELTTFVFVDCVHSQTPPQTLRNNLRKMISTRKRQWKGNVFIVNGKMKCQLEMYNVFTQLMSKTYQFENLVHYARDVKYTAISEIIQLRDGSLVISTKTNKLYICKDDRQQTIDLGYNGNEPNVPTCLIELKNGHIAIGYTNQVVVYDTNWKIFHVMKTPGHFVKELHDGRLITADDSTLILWDKYQFVQQTSNRGVYLISQYDTNIVLFQDINTWLWDLQTNVVTECFSEEDEYSIVGKDLNLQALNSGKIIDLKTREQTKLEHCDVSSFWNGGFAEVDEDVIAWPSGNGVVTYSIKNKEPKYYNLPGETYILRNYYFE